MWSRRAGTDQSGDPMEATVGNGESDVGEDMPIAILTGKALLLIQYWWDPTGPRLK